MSKWKCEICEKEFENFHAQGFDSKIYCPLCFFKEKTNRLEKENTQLKDKIKDLDNYIYASLSQPPIKILDKRNSNDELDFIVECPNCHSAVCYGTDIFMYSGHIYCSNKGCREEVVSKYEEAKKNE